MILHRLLSAAALLALMLCLSCVSALRPKTLPPEFYRMQYDTRDIACEAGFAGALRVWDFATSPPFNRMGMAVQEVNGTVAFSRRNQWAALPGIMVSNALERDLRQGSLFPEVLSASTDGEGLYELTGSVHVLCLSRGKNGGKALLKAEVALTGRQEAGELLYHEHFILRSPPLAGEEPDAFAQAMNELAAELSHRIRQDLCGVARRLSSG